MPTRSSDRPPTFAAYAKKRLCDPRDAIGLSGVFAIFLLMGGWVPLAAAHAVLDHAIAVMCRAMGVDRGIPASAFTVGLPTLLLFAGILRCDHQRYVQTWRTAVASP